MKYLNYLLAALFLGFLSSCDAGTLPTDAVGLSAAFGHCAQSASYWVWGLIVTAGIGFGAYEMKKAYDRDGSFSPALAFAGAALLLFVWCYRPSELAWNTTVEQAARGVWIGY